jgi:hypothetical protein
VRLSARQCYICLCQRNGCEIRLGRCNYSHQILYVLAKNMPAPIPRVNFLRLPFVRAIVFCIKIKKAILVPILGHGYLASRSRSYQARGKLSAWQAPHSTRRFATTHTHNHQLDEQTRAKREARRGARTHNLEIKSLTRYRLCQPGLKKQLLLLL